MVPLCVLLMAAGSGAAGTSERIGLAIPCHNEHLMYGGADQGEMGYRRTLERLGALSFGGAVGLDGQAHAAGWATVTPRRRPHYEA
jgi:hypothetical protein